MRRIIFLIIAAGLLISFSARAEELKMGYVDVFYIFSEYNKTKDYEDIITKKKEKAEKDNKLLSKKEELLKMQDTLGLLKGEEQIKHREKMQKAIIEYRNLEEQVVTELKKESDEKMQELWEEIRDEINDYAVKGGFDFIVNKSSVLYGKEAADLSKKIVKRLNDKYKK